MTKEKVYIEIPKKPSPILAIKKYCLQCGDGTRTEVEYCPIRDCPLHPYRFGVMPQTYAENNGLTERKRAKKKPVVNNLRAYNRRRASEQKTPK